MQTQYDLQLDDLSPMVRWRILDRVARLAELEAAEMLRELASHPGNSPVRNQLVVWQKACDRLAQHAGQLRQKCNESATQIEEQMKRVRIGTLGTSEGSAQAAN